MTFDPSSLSNFMLILMAWGGAFLAALWLSLIIWTYRDIRARARDPLGRILALLYAYRILDATGPERIGGEHLADQLVLPMALAGDRSQFRTTTVTQHLLTNAWVISQFLPGRVQVQGDAGQPGTCRVRGA